MRLLSSAYPYRILCPYPNGVFGVALLSRRPFAAGTEPHCDPRGAMAIATVDFGGTGVDVAAIHLSWPWPFEQSWQIGELSEPLAALGETSIMAGDCNAVPWSAAVRRVASLGELTVMPSAGPTWLQIKLPDFLRFRRTADRPGLQQGRCPHPFGVETGRHRLRSSSGDGGIFAQAGGEKAGRRA